MESSHGPTIVLETARARALVHPAAGGRVGSLVVGDLEMLIGDGRTRLEWGIYPMAPWAGRTRDARFTFGGVERTLPATMPPHAIHGTVLDREWVAAEVARDACLLETDLGPDWPFAGTATHRIELEDAADGAVLRLALTVATSDAAMPAVVGWHPWFPRTLVRGGPVQLAFDAGSMYEAEGGLPTGRLVQPGPGPWDDTFTDIRGTMEVRWPGAARIGIETSCDHVVVYDRAPQGVCVEPQTGPPDALNLGSATIVTPGRPLTATVAFHVRAGGD